jgi:tetratricopeptide (TPR) repeat protein
MFTKARKAAGGLILALAVACAFGYGFYGLLGYALPLSHNDFKQAQRSLVADQAEVLINGAALAYDEGRTGEAVKALELALENLVDKTGKYKAIDGWKIERVYFLLAKCYDRLKQVDKAIQNYENTLRLNPDHLTAKYDLERLLDGGGGSSSGQPQPQPGKLQPKI